MKGHSNHKLKEEQKKPNSSIPSHKRQPCPQETTKNTWICCLRTLEKQKSKSPKGPSVKAEISDHQQKHIFKRVPGLSGSRRCLLDELCCGLLGSVYAYVVLPCLRLSRRPHGRSVEGLVFYGGLSRAIAGDPRL